MGSPSKAPYEYPTIPYEYHLSSSLLTTQDISLKLKCLKWWKPRDRDHPCILSVLLGAIFISSWIFRPSRCSVIIVVSHVSTFCVRPLLSPGADDHPQRCCSEWGLQQWICRCMKKCQAKASVLIQSTNNSCNKIFLKLYFFVWFRGWVTLELHFTKKNRNRP